jgi:hypothetical protein
MKRLLCCLLPLMVIGLSGEARLFAGGLYENEMIPFTVPSARNYGMGGPHAAYTDDINSLFINPGAFVTANQFSAAELSVGVQGDIFGLQDALSGGDDVSGSLLSWVEKTEGKIPLGADIRGPLAFGKVGNGWGWGAFDRIYLDMRLVGSTISVGLYGDLMGNVGYAFRVLNKGVHTVDVGAQGKAFGRYFIETGKIRILEMASGDIENLTKKTTPFLILGGGIDIGAQYRFLDNLTGALAVTDLFTLGYAAPMSLPGIGSGSGTPDSYVAYVKPRINLGVSYKVFENSLVTWVLMADYRDLINLFQQNKYQSTNGVLNLSIGTEVILWDLVSFRLGMNEMLPAVGIGIDAKVLKLDAAIYGKELGNEPGKLSTYGLELGILFRY